jgi:hypothetical protein
MTNGEISGNTASSTRNNYTSYGGGVYLYDGTFTMSGGEISSNIAEDCGGVYVNYNATFTMSNGKISGHTAGGVRFNGTNATFTMFNGEISDNTNRSGGGVDLFGGKFIMHNGKISNNIATYGGGISGGGGVFVSNGTFTMNGGEISFNTARGQGGGVTLVSKATFIMNDGEISGNTADYYFDNGGYGGGVFVAADFTMNGGVIADNKAIESPTDGFAPSLGWGGGVFVSLGNSGIFKNLNGSIYNNIANKYGSAYESNVEYQ